MNSAQPEHEDSQDSEEEKDTRKTSAYAFGSIENTPTEFVVDTGAGGCMIAKDYLDRLGYAIEKPTKLTFMTATGVRAVPLGKVHEIPVKLGDITVPMDMVVVQTTTYEVILRTEWLDKVHAVIDFNAQKMKITRRGRSSIIPIDINRGICSAMQEEEEIEREAYIMQTVYQNDLEIDEQEQNDEPKEDMPSMPKEPKVREPVLRLMTQEERARAFNLMILESQCAFCKARVYCAEMTCDCPWTERITGTLEEAWYKKQTYCCNETDMYSDYHQIKIK